MAKLIKRVWTARGPGGHKVRKVAYGYTLQVDGKQERKAAAEWDREAAEKALAARLLKLDAEAAPTAPEPKTLAQVAEEYLAYKRAKGKRSIAVDVLALKIIRARVGDATLVRDVTAQRVAQYDRARSGEKSTRGTPVSPATVNRELVVLRHMLRLAEEWGYIDRAPKVRLAREPRGRLRYLSEEEIPRLLTACEAKRTKSPHLLPVVVLALNTGMRKGEILGLRWEHVDFASARLYVDESKNGERRGIPMNAAVDHVLAPLHAEARAALEGGAGESRPELQGLIFRKRDGRAWGNIRTGFEAACRDAKVAGFRFHDLRHTAASWMIMRGRSLKEVQEILGHKEFRMTLRYAHLAPERLREAVAVLEDFSTKSAQSASLDSRRAVSVHAPVAQLDRASPS